MVIYILWLRQIKRYIRARSRIIGALGQPLLYLLALGFGLGPVFARAGAGNYLAFLVPGVIAQSILFTSIFAGIEVIWDKQFGFLKETLVAPVSRWEIMLGRTLGGATVATFQGLLVLGIAFVLGFRPASYTFMPLVPVYMAIIAILSTSLGTAIASLVDDMQGFQLIMNFLVLPLYFLSGALFPLKGIPPILKTITYFDPLTYGVDGMRHLLSHTGQLPFSTDLFVLILTTMILLSIGSYLFSKIQI